MPKHYLHVFSTFDPGGPQVRTVRLLELLPGSYRHTVVAMDGRTGCAERVARWVGLDVLAAPAVRGLLPVARGIAGVIRRVRPDLLLTYNWGAIESLLAARFAGHRAVVHHEEGFGAEETERLFRRRNWMRRVLLPRARAVVVPSRVLERIAREVWRQPAARVRYLPNGVDVGRFTGWPGLERGPGWRPVIGSVASFRPVKNHPLLLRAFAAMQNPARLLLVGDGAGRPAAVQLARELGVADRVEFVGLAANTADFYPQMDVFAMSSHSEQMPIVVLEAMACGLPVASPDVGDVREMVAELNRPFVVAREDAGALAGALDRLVADAGLRAEIGAANRVKCVDSFEEGECLGRYVELYEKIAGG